MSSRETPLLILGCRLRELDIELMKRLSPRVNVIPVIGKADSLTPPELAESKKLVMEDIEHYRIPVYNFPYDVEEDDEDIWLILRKSPMTSYTRTTERRN